MGITRCVFGRQAVDSIALAVAIIREDEDDPITEDLCTEPEGKSSPLNLLLPLGGGEINSASDFKMGVIRQILSPLARWRGNFYIGFIFPPMYSRTKVVFGFFYQRPHLNPLLENKERIGL